MTSSRATEVAEILWELKQADKLATFTTIARRAGFSAGANCRTVKNTLDAVRRGWPHLQWWRAIEDNGVLDPGSEHAEKLREFGYEIEPVGGRKNTVILSAFSEHLMEWKEEVDGAAHESSR